MQARFAQVCCALAPHGMPSRARTNVRKQAKRRQTCFVHLHCVNVTQRRAGEGLRVRGFEHNSISALQNKPYDQRITNQLFAATGTTSATASVGIATAAMTAARKRPAKTASLAR